MNPRLQVEHCVTEMVTGIDLVAEQLLIADGQPVSITSINRKGHAIEMRINAEDPFQNFMPAPGMVTEYREPDGFGVRVDGWVQTGTTVSQYYDNLMAKLIVWAPDRDRAIARAKRALGEYDIHGVPTTIPAHQQVLAHADFAAGRHHTRWIEDDIDLVSSGPPPAETLPSEEDTVRRSMTVEIGGRRYSVAYWTTDGTGAGGEPRRKRPVRKKAATAGAGDGIHTAPMQGTIVKVSVKAGDRVSTGDTICVLEAMKMENEVKALNDGEVVDLRVQAGDTVTNGEVIAVVR
jgi:acetyl-CoA/propionyl-CoA carboxylase biotin carboxyl carrier protein